jgi:uncharacterized OB-fold protein
MEYVMTHRKFIDTLKKGEFLGLKCKRCGAYNMPPSKVCLDCNTEDMEVVNLSGVGELQTFTVIRVAPEGFQAPFIVALVKLQEGPWVMANVVNVEPDKATMNLIGCKGKVGYKQVPADSFSGGERMAFTFEVAN